jgi:hypothetical protein
MPTFTTITVYGTTLNVYEGYVNSTTYGFYINQLPQISLQSNLILNGFYINPDTAVILFNTVTQGNVNMTAIVYANTTTYIILTTNTVVTLYNISPTLTMSVIIPPSNMYSFVFADANTTPSSVLRNNIALAFVGFLIGIALLSNIFIRGNRYHVIIGIAIALILASFVSYIFGISLYYVAIASVIGIIAIPILVIITRNEENK